MPEEEAQSDQTEEYSMSPLFKTQKYSYKSKSLPGKPQVLSAGENQYAAPVQSGVNFQFGTVIE
jgi:hypothetical protein